MSPGINANSPSNFGTQISGVTKAINAKTDAKVGDNSVVGTDNKAKVVATKILQQTASSNDISPPILEGAAKKPPVPYLPPVDSDSKNSQDSSQAASSNDTKTTVDAHVDPDVSIGRAVIEEKIDDFHVFYDAENHTTYIVKNGVEISDPILKPTVKKLQEVAISLVNKSAASSSKGINSKFNAITENLTLNNDSGTYHKKYTQNGEEKSYDTGMTDDSLKALLQVSNKMQHVSAKTFMVIGKTGKSEKFVSDNSGSQKELGHIGRHIADGGAGKISQAWLMSRNKVVIHKESKSPDIKQAIKRSTPTDVEAANLHRVNPRGKNPHLQPPPHLTYSITGLSNVETGLFTKMYDGDFSEKLGIGQFGDNDYREATKMTADKIVDLGIGLFRGAVDIDKQNVLYLDLKPSNLFMEGDKAVIADWDAARFMDKNYFDSKEFIENPAGDASIDSVHAEDFNRLQSTGKAILNRKEIQSMSKAEKKNRIAEYRGYIKNNKTEISKKRKSGEDVSTERKTIENLKGHIERIKDPKKMNTSLFTLKKNYLKMAKNIPTKSIGHVIYQALTGKINLRMYEADSEAFGNLRNSIREEYKNNVPEKNKRLALAGLAQRCMESFPNLKNNDIHSPIPTHIQANDALKALKQLKKLT